MNLHFFWFSQHVLLEPNPDSRFAEFGKAVAEIRLEDAGSPLRYLGFIKSKDSTESTSFKDLQSSIRSKVWDFWDLSPLAPVKTRPREESSSRPLPALQVLAFQDGQPIFPDVIRNRFPQGTAEHGEIEVFFEKFAKKFPPAPQRAAAAAASGAAPPRSGGLCDFSINGGKLPLDPFRVVDLVAVKDDDFQVRRTEC